jgi:phosphoribosylaminoimidazolecarboxamide formyltransferase/IMP cyclohydrolase
VNLYPFHRQVTKNPTDRAGAVEEIDIGGPTMVRAAAKNHAHVAVIIDPGRYEEILGELRANERRLSEDTRLSLAVQAFRHVSLYDSMIARFLGGFTRENDPFPHELTLPLVRRMSLRYGENPHQRASFYTDPLAGEGWTHRFTQLGGKELSTNNILDADSVWRLMADLPETACAIVKHNNPCGVGFGGPLREAYENALRTDPVSAFGGIVSANAEIDEQTAALLADHFFEVIMAPAFAAGALAQLGKKKNLRLLRVDPAPSGGASRPLFDLDFRSVEGGAILQDRDRGTLDREKLKVVTAQAPGDSQRRALELAWIVAKHVKSNAIVLAGEKGTLGIGAGQMSRVDSVRISVEKAKMAGLSTQGCVLASDAFFPFRDGVDVAAEAGVRAIIQPGGSVRDEEVIAAANEHGIAMLFTGMRHFRH